MRISFRPFVLVVFVFIALVSAHALNAPATLSVTGLKATGFTLKWTAATGATGGVAGYDVYRDGALIGSTPGTTRSLVLTGLAPVTTYAMTVVARDGAGSFSPSSSSLPVTTLADTTAPARPTALLSSALTTTSFTLSWTAPADNVAVAGYKIYRAGVQVGTSSSSSFALTGLTPDTVNRMTVRAHDGAGNLSATSAALNVRTLANPPSIPSGLNIINLKAVSFTLKWTASTGGTGGIAGYDIYRDGVLAGTTTRVSYNFTALTPLTTYNLTITARDHEGRVSPPELGALRHHAGGHDQAIRTQEPRRIRGHSCCLHPDLERFDRQCRRPELRCPAQQRCHRHHCHADPSHHRPRSLDHLCDESACPRCGRQCLQQQCGT